MPTPTLTPAELLAYLTLRLERFENLGIAREDAVRAIALDDGIDEDVLLRLLSPAGS